VRGEEFGKKASSIERRVEGEKSRGGEEGRGRRGEREKRGNP
jgi:hypothetical protein